jgi:hypothetical protein
VSHTKEKLLEAKYFLERMTEKQAEPDFIYNLSAFLGAARSVTLVMQTQHNGAAGFNKWYTQKQAEMQGNKEMRLLNDKRVMTIHKKPVRPRAHDNIRIPETVTVGETASVVLTHADGTIERLESEPTPPPTQARPAKTEMTTERRWYFNELPEKDVLTICQEYIFKLNTLVEECESRLTP